MHFGSRTGSRVFARAGCAILATAAAAVWLRAASPAAAGTASGHFDGRTITLPMRGAYSFWDAAGNGNGRTIKVALSNSTFPEDLIDNWYDKSSVLHDLFASDDVKLVYFEFDPDGRYRGYSYYFGSGDGCGYCYDSKVTSTVHAAGGRLTGRLTFQGGPVFDIEFDVRIPDRAWGDPLPANGGDPFKAYLAYHKALVDTDVDALKAVSSTWLRGLIDTHQAAGDLSDFVDFRWDEKHFRMKTVAATGGYVRGDRAVLLIDGSSTMFDALHGDAILVKEDGTWRVDDELMQIGKR